MFPGSTNNFKGKNYNSDDLSGVLSQYQKRRNGGGAGDSLDKKASYQSLSSHSSTSNETSPYSRFPKKQKRKNQQQS
jgi:hypothetical protein